MKKLSEKLIRVKLQLEDMKLDLKDDINNLPDNPNIERIKGQTGAFVMSLSQITSDKGMNMSPRYYDFKFQGEFLCQIIDHSDPFTLEEKLNKIVETGKTKHWFDGNDRFGTSTESFKFHPSVLKALDAIIKSEI